MRLTLFPFCGLVLLGVQVVKSLPASSSKDAQCTNISPVNRVDCHPDPNSNQENCQARGCCWTVQIPPEVSLPYCYYPKGYVGYNVSVVDKGSDVLHILLRRTTPSGLPKDIDQIGVKIYQLTDTMVRIRITDAHQKRFEPPLPVLNLPKGPPRFPLYNVAFNQSGQIVISRVSTGKIVFYTDLRSLIFTDQYHQISSTLPDKYLYGLGEHKDVFRKEATWKRYTMFNRDQYPVPNTNLYGSHPFHFSIEDGDGHSSGMLLLNSNAMDIMTSPLPAITYRPIGGILDMFVFVENSPEDLIKTYINLIGLPPMPPLWALGFHLCKFGYQSLNHTIQVWNRTRNAMIPFDAQWNDIDYMKDYNDFTYDTQAFEGLPEFVNELHKLGMHYVVILDPGVSGGEKPDTYPPYDDGMKMDVFIKNASGQVLIGHTWNRSGKTVYPDFTHPNATAYWTKQVQDMHNMFEFDGLWIDMNEISTINADGSLDGCPNSTLEDPVYLPGDVPLKTKTICMTAKLHLGQNYDLHNLYATYEALATKNALETVRPGKRTFILSRASFVGFGKYASHWDGDIVSDWESMGWTIPSIMEFNMFGVPLIGADICGFNQDTTVELCARWSQLGAFYPFSRNHNSDDTREQDPVILGDIVVKANKVAFDLRYKLLPYLYTLFYRAHTFAETVARPMFFVFPKDQIARQIETQFMWGDGLMIAPVLTQGSTSVHAYLPAGRWYFVDTLNTVLSNGQYFDFETPIDKINVLLRGSKAIAMADDNLRTTTDLHQVPFKIVAGLDDEGLATGELYWDDGESLNSQESGNYNLVKFEIEKNLFKTVPVNNGYKVVKKLSSIVLLGVKQKPNNVIVNGKSARFTYLASKQVLSVSLSKENYDIFQANVLTWN